MAKDKAPVTPAIRLLHKANTSVCGDLNHVNIVAAKNNNPGSLSYPGNLLHASFGFKGLAAGSI